MKEFLENNLERMNYWLQFAEAKNGTILLLNGTATTILFQMSSFGLNYYILVILFLIASLLALFSFIPNFAINTYKNKTKINPNDNLLFWKTVSKYSIKEYKQKLVENIDKSYNFTMKDEYIIEQIINNSKIASYKYILFDIEVKIDILALIIIIVSVVIA